MPVLIAQKNIFGTWSVVERNTYVEARKELKRRAKLAPAALLHKAKKGELIIFEGKRRAAEQIMYQILEEDE
jgi:hypothetical protein